MIFRTAFWGVVVSAALWFGWMCADNTTPYVYDAEQSHMVPDPAIQGSMVTADWKLKEVRRICPGSVQRFFRDIESGKIVATLDTTPVSRAVKAVDNNLPRSFVLPPNLPEVTGYSAEICFECNPLQHVFPLCMHTPEIRFRVLQ